MESVKASDNYDAKLRIRQYLEGSEQIGNTNQPAGLSLSARLCSDILELFLKVLLTISRANCPELPSTEHISLERSFSQLKLWSDGFGVSRGELDDLLDKSGQLRRDTLRLLRSIGINITERLLPHLFSNSSDKASLEHTRTEVKTVLARCDDDGDSTASGDFIDSMDDNLQEMTKDLQTDTLCLMELGDLISDPVLDSIRETEWLASHEALMGWTPRQTFCNYIKSQFPQADEHLVIRLGKANYERHARCQQEHQAHGKIMETRGLKPELTLTSSIPTATSHEKTLIPSQASVESFVRVPTLPAEAKDGNPFECFVCGRVVQFSKDPPWREHLYSDLRPWVCLDVSCPHGDMSFKNRDDWISHLSLYHNSKPRWRSFECPLCHAKTGTGKTAITRHLGAHLREISLAALPISVGSERNLQGAVETDSGIKKSDESDSDLIKSDENVLDIRRADDSDAGSGKYSERGFDLGKSVKSRDHERSSTSRANRRSSKSRDLKRSGKRGSRLKRSDKSGSSLKPSGRESAKQHVMHLWDRLRIHVVPPDKYVYPILKGAWGQDIRVLIIEPGDLDDPISCRLVPCALNNVREKAGTKAQPFIALSYFWGDGHPTHPISLTSYENPGRKLEKLSTTERLTIEFAKGKTWTPTGTILVRSNLYRALQRFRHKTKNVTMWIDALCIDQEDENERSGQVKKLHELYLNSEKVRVWLGTGDGNEPNPGDCFQFLRKLLHLKDLKSTLEKRSAGELDLAQNVDNIEKLMRNKWFSRRWVLQELTLAPKVEVVYGEETMPWSDFSDAIAIFTKSFDLIRSILKDEMDPSAMGELATTDSVKNLSANALVEFTNNLFRRGEHGEIQQRMMTLEGLVSSLLAFEASDPRDTIYAVLSLAKDTYHLSTDPNENAAYLKFDPRLTPNYKHKSLIHVYTEFIDYCIEKSGSLDILFRYWAPSMERNRLSSSQSKVPTVGEYSKKEDSLPSWVPRLQNSSHGTPGQRNGERTNGDSFVGASHRSGQRNYSAASDFPPTYKFGEEEPPLGSRTANKKYNGRLSLKGLHIGKILRVAPRAAYGVIFEDAFDIAGFERDHWDEHQEWAPGVSRVPEEFWRTLVGDRGPNGSNPPSWYARACRDCLDELTEDGDLQPEVLIASESTSRLTKDFLERVKNVIWQRRLGRVHLKGLNHSVHALGLFPAETREDDFVCILLGCSVPVVLRPSTQDPGHYTMVGECFVYGMMEGEAVTGRSPDDGDNNDYDVQFFELV